MKTNRKNNKFQTVKKHNWLKKCYSKKKEYEKEMVMLKRGKIANKKIKKTIKM